DDAILSTMETEAKVRQEEEKQAKLAKLEEMAKQKEQPVNSPDDRKRKLLSSISSASLSPLHERDDEGIGGAKASSAKVLRLDSPGSSHSSGIPSAANNTGQIIQP